MNMLFPKSISVLQIKRKIGGVSYLNVYVPAVLPKTAWSWKNMAVLMNRHFKYCFFPKRYIIHFYKSVSRLLNNVIYKNRNLRDLWVYASLILLHFEHVGILKSYFKRFSLSWLWLALSSMESEERTVLTLGSFFLWSSMPT